MGSSQWIALLGSFGLDSKNPDNCVIPKVNEKKYISLNNNNSDQCVFGRNLINVYLQV